MNKVLDWIKKHKWKLLDGLAYWGIAILLIYSNIETWRFMILIPLILFYGYIQVKKENKNERN